MYKIYPDDDYYSQRDNDQHIIDLTELKENEPVWQLRFR